MFAAAPNRGRDLPSPVIVGREILFAPLGKVLPGNENFQRSVGGDDPLIAVGARSFLRQVGGAPRRPP